MPISSCGIWVIKWHFWPIPLFPPQDDNFISLVMRKPVFRFPTRSDIHCSAQQKKFQLRSRGIVPSMKQKQRCWCTVDLHLFFSHIPKAGFLITVRTVAIVQCGTQLCILNEPCCKKPALGGSAEILIPNWSTCEATEEHSEKQLYKHQNPSLNKPFFAFAYIW